MNQAVHGLIKLKVPLSATKVHGASEPEPFTPRGKQSCNADIAHVQIEFVCAEAGRVCVRGKSIQNKFRLQILASPFKTKATASVAADCHLKVSRR